MLPDNGRRVNEEYDYHMSNEEVGILLQHLLKQWSMKFYLFASITWGKGHRCSEALALNVLTDFPNVAEGDFTRYHYREAKTNKVHYNEIMPEP